MAKLPKKKATKTASATETRRDSFSWADKGTAKAWFDSWYHENEGGKKNSSAAATRAFQALRALATEEGLTFEEFKRLARRGELHTSSDSVINARAQVKGEKDAKS